MDVKVSGAASPFLVLTRGHFGTFSVGFMGILVIFSGFKWFVALFKAVLGAGVLLRNMQDMGVEPLGLQGSY